MFRGLKILISKTVAFYISRSILDRNQGAPYAPWCILFHRLASRAATFVARRGGPNGQAPRSIWVILLSSFFLFFAQALSFATDSAHPSLCPTISPVRSLLPAVKVTQLRLTCCWRRYSCWFLQNVLYIFLCVFFTKDNYYTSEKSMLIRK